MNRSILIVICDFLLVSLLAFSSIDVNKMGKPGEAKTVKLEISTNAAATSGKDLAAVMRVALDEERRNRDLLMRELTKTRESLGQQQSVLSEREQQVRSYQQELQAKEAEAAGLQREQTGLQQQFAAAQTNLQTLGQQLQQSSMQAVISKEKLAAMEAELKKQTEQATALQNQISTLQHSNQLVLNDRMRLSTQLQVAEVEKRFAAERVAQMQQQVNVEREEKAKLAEGVKTLASRSDALTQEIRENRPLAANTIFYEVLTNRIQASFHAVRIGTFGIDSNKRKTTDTIVVTDGTNNYAICHIDDTPLVLWNPGTDWESLNGTLTGTQAQLSIRSLSFYRRDPRLVMIPLSRSEVRQLGAKAFQVAADPFKFQDAVLVGAREGYHGECRFQIDVSTPEYVKLDNSFIKGLFGKFNPSRGDLVLSKNGEVLGIMANNSYCLMLQNFSPAASFQLAKDLRPQNPGRILSQLYSIVQELPPKLH